jgi:LysM repeat protein
MGIKTNYPISPKERLAVAFEVPETANMIIVTGEVAWRQFRRDVRKTGEPLYGAGIKFVRLDEPSRSFISDYIETGGEGMNHRDKVDTLELDFEEDSTSEEDYSTQREKRESWFAGKLLGKSVFSFLAGALAVFVIFLIAGFFLRSSNVNPEIKLRSLENRIKQIEDRGYRIDWIEAKLEQVVEQNKQFTMFMDTFRKLEAPRKISTTQNSQEQTRAVYYEVVNGDTLYSISRRHGLTVEELRRLNQITSEAIIHPKQRLLVRPVSDR